MTTTVASVRPSPRHIVQPRFLGFGAEFDPGFWHHDFNRDLGVTEDDWQMLMNRIRWMRMPVARIMMQMNWCRRSDGRLDFETAPMRSLYRHLDYCEENGVTVLLTEWFYNLPQAPLALESCAYADVVGRYIEHLVRQRGYSCIRYFILLNEPNLLIRTGVFWDTWEAGVRNIAAQLRERRLHRHVRLMGADPSHGDSWHYAAVHRLHDLLGAYDIHRYEWDARLRSCELEDYYREKWMYVRRHDPRGNRKPCFVTECGMTDGAEHPVGNRNIDSHFYAVFMADYAVQAARAGSAGVLAWHLDDSSHKDFFWGLWTGKKEQFRLRPWFYPWSLLTRFFPSGSAIHAVANPTPDVHVLAASIPTRRSDHPHRWSFCLVNRGKRAWRGAVEFPDPCRHPVLCYLCSPSVSPRDGRGFPVPQAILPPPASRLVPIACAPDSVFIITSLSDPP